MTVKIQFFDNFSETTLPTIRLTKSRNGQTGTATFLFKNPTIFKYFKEHQEPIREMALIWEGRKIRTVDINIHFLNGQPVILESLFIFTSTQNWFHFLNFMNYYSKETGLSYEYPGKNKERSKNSFS